MKVYHDLESFERIENAVVTTGTFDGVHLGHQKILRQLVDKAEREKGESVIFTFDPHPRHVLQPDTELKLLNSKSEKIERLEKLGIDHVIFHPFTREFSRLTSTEYIRDVLVNAIGTNHLIIGYDHHFGRNREGSFDHLLECGPTYGFEVEEITALAVDEVNISSTKIRNALSAGDIAEANKFLSYPYTFTGTVVQGEHIGRSIGFPTANLNPVFKHKLIPADGVYAVLIYVGSTCFRGMLNIGNRPTVSSAGQRSIEANLFDFSGDLYNHTLTVQFVARIRSEQKFNSLEDLKAQLTSDKSHTLNAFTS